MFPLHQHGEVQQRDGTVLASGRCGIWRRRNSSASVSGMQYDYDGAIDIGVADAVMEKRNLTLVTGGLTFHIVDAIDHRPSLPYIELKLRRNIADG